eukprot:126656-Chlamydomonas_euryale.AAC.1
MPICMAGRAGFVKERGRPCKQDRSWEVEQAMQPELLCHPSCVRHLPHQSCPTAILAAPNCRPSCPTAILATPNCRPGCPTAILAAPNRHQSCSTAILAGSTATGACQQTKHADKCPGTPRRRWQPRRPFIACLTCGDRNATFCGGTSGLLPLPAPAAIAAASEWFSGETCPVASRRGVCPDSGRSSRSVTTTVTRSGMSPIEMRADAPSSSFTTSPSSNLAVVRKQGEVGGGEDGKARE